MLGITNMKIYLVDTGFFDTVHDLLVDGEYDGITAGFKRTSERKVETSATIPYHNGFVIFLQK